MGFIKKEILIGVLVCFFVTLASMFLFVEYLSKYEFNQTINLLKKGNLFGKVASICALPNLLVFTIYLKKKKEYRARGIVIGTLSIALITFLLKII